MFWLVVLLAIFANTYGTTAQRAEFAPPREAVPVEEPTLKVVGIYGVRNSSTDDLRVIKVHVELAIRADPVALRDAVVRFDDEVHVRNYMWGDAPIADGHAEDAPHFATTWIRGDGSGGVMEAGDLVEIAFVAHEDLAERTWVSLLLVPEEGASVAADFRTPPAYGSDRVITLR